MKTRHLRFFHFFVVASLMAARLLSAETAPTTAVVKANVANVRGQPSLIGEVVTRLKQGDKVVILEEVKVKSTKNDDNTNWFRIQMPANTPVWVNAGFMDTNSNTVKPPKLNLRAGPGENFSVVGRLVKGEAVKPIRTVETWIEIECPTNAYAFLAANLVEKITTSPALLDVEKPKASPVDAAKDVVKTESEKPIVANPPPIVETVKLEEPPATVSAAQSVASNTTAPATTSVAAAPALGTPPALVTPPPIAPPLAQPNLAPPKRIVRREGTVSGWVSIVAPTGYTLKNPDNGHVMNYLQSASTNIVLKNYRGKRVVVTGEEGVDPRWVETPVLTVHTLEIAPNGTK